MAIEALGASDEVGDGGLGPSVVLYREGDGVAKGVDPLVIAHRGASRVEMENTLPAFARAVAMGAAMIELDVQRSADGALVVIHDEDTLRVTGGQGGPVAALTLAELQTLRVGQATIPTLREALELARDAGVAVNVELKGPGVAGGVVALVRGLGLRATTLLSSFDSGALAEARDLDPGLRLAVLMGTETLRPMTRLREAYPLPLLRRLKADAWHPHYRLVNPLVLRAVQRAGYKVNVWTVNEPEQMRRLVRLGVDGIITDVPDALRALLSEGVV